MEDKSLSSGLILSAIYKKGLGGGFRRVGEFKSEN